MTSRRLVQGCPRSFVLPVGRREESVPWAAHTVEGHPTVRSAEACVSLWLIEGTSAWTVRLHLLVVLERATLTCSDRKQARFLLRAQGVLGCWEYSSVREVLPAWACASQDLRCCSFKMGIREALKKLICMLESLWGLLGLDWREDGAAV